MLINDKSLIPFPIISWPSLLPYWIGPVLVSFVCRNSASEQMETRWCHSLSLLHDVAYHDDSLFFVVEKSSWKVMVKGSFCLGGANRLFSLIIFFLLKILVTLATKPIALNSCELSTKKKEEPESNSRLSTSHCALNARKNFFPNSESSVAFPVLALVNGLSTAKLTG